MSIQFLTGADFNGCNAVAPFFEYCSFNNTLFKLAQLNKRFLFATNALVLSKQIFFLEKMKFLDEKDIENLKKQDSPHKKCLRNIEITSKYAKKYFTQIFKKFSFTYFENNFLYSSNSLKIKNHSNININELPIGKNFNKAFGHLKGSFLAKETIYCKNKFLLTLLASKCVGDRKHCDFSNKKLKNINLEDLNYIELKNFTDLLNLEGSLPELEHTNDLLKNFPKTKKINELIKTEFSSFIKETSSNSGVFTIKKENMFSLKNIFLLKKPKTLYLIDYLKLNHSTVTAKFFERKIFDKHLKNFKIPRSFNKFDIIPCIYLPTNFLKINHLLFNNQNLRTLSQLPKFPNLKKLDVSCNKITYLSPENINKSFPKLEKFNVSRNNLSEKNINNLTRNCLQIQNLKFSSKVSEKEHCGLLAEIKKLTLPIRQLIGNVERFPLDENNAILLNTSYDSKKDEYYIDLKFERKQK